MLMFSQALVKDLLKFFSFFLNNSSINEQCLIVKYNRAVVIKILWNIDSGGPA